MAKDSVLADLGAKGADGGAARELTEAVDRYRIDRAPVCLADHDPAVLTNRPVQLPHTHVDRVDASCAVAQEAVCEPSGGRSDINADPPIDFDYKPLDRRVQLEAAPANEPWPLPHEPNRRFCADPPARLVCLLLVDQHLAGHDHGLRLVPRLGQASLD